MLSEQVELRPSGGVRHARVKHAAERVLALLQHRAKQPRTHRNDDAESRSEGCVLGRVGCCSAVAATVRPACTSAQPSDVAWYLSAWAADVRAERAALNRSVMPAVHRACADRGAPAPHGLSRLIHAPCAASDARALMCGLA